MKSVVGSSFGLARQWLTESAEAWSRFWFTPCSPRVISVLRILAGAMLVYSHLVWAMDLGSFLGPDAWIDNDTAKSLHDGSFGFSDAARSYLWNIDSMGLLWAHHVVAILIAIAFTLGFLTRLSGPLSLFLQLMLLHRLTGMLFGLDQILTYCLMYLSIGPSGACYSVDAWLRRRLTGDRLAWLFPADRPSVSANVATRLLQIHLCVIYFFGGIAKARGTTWWDGSAMWLSAANYEYQSVPLTWIVDYPRLGALLSNATMLWELSYVALIWPRLTRPVFLVIAVMVHAGIGIFLGMITFGTMMIIANLIFVSPKLFSCQSCEA
ncbi:MAG: HTTM domain-containing protein [Planctomycetota bacterium]